MTAYVLGVRGFVPENVVSNDDLVAGNPGWDSDKIFENSAKGIERRRQLVEEKKKLKFYKKKKNSK